MEQRKNYWAGAIAMTSPEKIVLVLDKNGFWGIPGGGGRVGETPPQTVVREVFEEIGVVIIEESLVKFELFNQGHKKHVYITEIEPFGSKEIIGDDDIVEAKEYTLEEAFNLGEKLKTKDYVFLEKFVRVFTREAIIKTLEQIRQAA